MFRFIKKLFKKNYCTCVTLTLQEIKELAEFAGFKVCKFTDYDVHKDDFSHAINVYEDYHDGFVFYDDDGDPEVYRVVCNLLHDTDYEFVEPLGKNVLEED